MSVESVLTEVRSSDVFSDFVATKGAKCAEEMLLEGLTWHTVLSNMTDLEQRCFTMGLIAEMIELGRRDTALTVLIEVLAKSSETL